MDNKDIWIVFTKSTALEGCSIDMDGCEFYFGEAFVPAENMDDIVANIENVMGRTQQALLEIRLTLSGIAKCICYKEGEWTDDSKMNAEINKTARQALKSAKIVFNTFRSQEVQDDCVYTFGVHELGDECFKR